MSTLVIITGASRGIGRSAAIAFASDPRIQKLSLCLIARNEDGLFQTKAMVHHVKPANEIDTKTYSIDLSDLSCLESSMETVFRKQLESDVSPFKRAILINNAGSLGHLGSSAELPSPTELQRNVDFNVTSAVWITSYFVKHFAQERKIRCNVVNISSLCAVKPFRTMAVYCAGKAARNMFHKTLGLEHQDGGLLKVLNYAPGVIETDMTAMLSKSQDLDSELSEYYNKVREERTYIKPLATAERLVNLLMEDTYSTGDHIDYWDLEK